MIQSKRHQKALEYALQTIRTSPVYPDVTGVYLYGSCAKQTETERSDVDLLVELNLTEELDDDMRTDLRLLKTDVMTDDWRDPEVDLKFVIGDEWKTSTMMFYKNIQKEGIQICL